MFVLDKAHKVPEQSTEIFRTRNFSKPMGQANQRCLRPASPMLTRYLKRTIGLTPSEYRNKNR